MISQLKKNMDLSLGLNSTGSGIPPDFAFAFNDINFSDRVLRIEILPDFSTGSTRTRKPSRSEETVQKENDADVVMQRGEQIPNYILLDSEDDLDDENQDEEAVRMLDESPSGVEMTANPSGDDEAAIGGDSPTNMESSNPLRVRIIHISSPILAAKSPFFYKLFSNGMKESEQRHATIRINESEEAALVDLLNFMYSNTLATTTPDGLLDVLMAADKFEVVSCMRYCSCLLQNLRMTCESALLYLDLPSSVLTADAVLPLTDAAKQFLAAHFQDITKFEQEALNLPLAGVEAVLSSDDLQIASEDAVCDFVLKWARIHYPKLDERREVLGSRLCHLIRFPCMTCRKLKKVLTWNDFDPELASKLVLEALFYKAGVKSKAEAPYRQRDLAAEHTNALCHRYVDRAYKYKPVKIVEFEIPYQQCVVYLDLKREELANLFPAGRVYSQAFHLGGQGFFLSAHCNLDQQNTFHCFGLFLGMQERGSVSFAVDYEFAARTKPSEEYVNRYKGVYMFTGGKAVGYRNLFGISWNSFIAEDSVYFINGILHLRAELTIRQ